MDSDIDVECKLIELVSEKRLLYDKRIQEYKNRNKRNMAWEVIGKELNRSADYCQKLWINLRSQYMAHRRKLRAPSGSGTGNRPYFRHEGTMQFIKYALEEKRTYSSIPLPPIINLGESEYEHVSAEEPTDAAEKEVMVQRKTVEGCKSNKTTQKRKLDLFEEEMLKVVRNEIDDEYAAFGKLVAVKLRKLANDDPVKCNEVQLDIATLLYQFETKKYNVS